MIASTAFPGKPLALLLQQLLCPRHDFFGNSWLWRTSVCRASGSSMFPIHSIFANYCILSNQYLIYITFRIFRSYLVDFFCFLIDGAAFSSFFSDSLVWAFSLLLLSDLLWWLSPTLSIIPDEAGVGHGICAWEGLSVMVVIMFAGTWIFLQATLVPSILFKVLCFMVAWDDWIGQGKTSQSKCMWAGTCAIVWGWETEEPETSKAGKGGGPEAGGEDLWASLVSSCGAVMCRCVSFCETSGGWILRCCYERCKKEENKTSCKSAIIIQKKIKMSNTLTQTL